MTKPRAEALGVVGPGAYWGNERVPDLTLILARTKINPRAIRPPLAHTFVDWLGPRLSDYRVHVAAHNDMPQISAEIAWMEEAERDVAGFLARGGRKLIPTHADAAAYYAAHKAGHNWFEIVRKRDSDAIARALREGREALQRQSAKAPNVGKPSKAARDELHEAVTRRLRSEGVPDERHAAELARRILIAAGIKMPSLDSLARACRRRKQGAILSAS